MAGSIGDSASYVRMQLGRRLHLHSGIRYVTPSDRHPLRDSAILARRHAVYTAARRRTPTRWSGDTRDWTPVGDVFLNPIKRETRVAPLATPVH